MSGHSKWSKIKTFKGAIDAKRGKIFSKLGKEITIAAKLGGGDPDLNPRLRMVLLRCRAASMPTDNIERAIKRGSGDLEGEVFEESTFEGYAPGGVALIVQVLTNNRNRTAAELRHVFGRFGASFAGQGSVLRSFQRKGQILVDGSKTTEDKLMEIVLEAGGEDIKSEGDHFEIITDPAQFMNVVDALNKVAIPMESSEIALLPDLSVPVSDKAKASSLVKFVEELEDLDDVQNVYSNFDIDPATLEAIQKA